MQFNLNKIVQLFFVIDIYLNKKITFMTSCFPEKQCFVLQPS